MPWETSTDRSRVLARVPVEGSPAGGALWPEGHASSGQYWLPSMGLQVSEAVLTALKQTCSDAKASRRKQKAVERRL